MRRTRLWLGLVLAAAAALIVALWLRGGDEPEGAARRPAAQGDSPTSGQHRPAFAAADAGAHRPASVRVRGADVRRWKQLLAEVSQARARRQQRSAGRSAAPAGDDVARAPTLDRDYIRARIADLHDLIAECYDMALEQRPRSEGRLVVEFTIASEPDVGGVVTESRIDPERSSPAVATDPVLAECIRETMYAADFAAATEPGEVHVAYPFVFRNGPPDGG